jgi:hypothetical protein
MEKSISIIRDDPPPTPPVAPLIPSAEIYFNLDALQRLKTHMYRKIMEGLSKIKPMDVKIPNVGTSVAGFEGGLLYNILVKMTASIEDMYMFLEPKTQSVRVEIMKLKVHGTAKIKGDVKFFFTTQKLDAKLDLVGGGPHFRIVALSTTQLGEPDGLLPALKITTNEGKIDDITAKIDDDSNIGAIIMNKLAEL